MSVPFTTCKAQQRARDMVEDLPRQVPIEDAAASVDGRAPELLPENGALLKNVKESQVTSIWVT
jgi:hypothetical protein